MCVLSVILEALHHSGRWIRADWLKPRRGESRQTIETKHEDDDENLFWIGAQDTVDG